MSISLKKGQKISLSKESAGLTAVLVGLGWDEAQQSEHGFKNRNPEAIDCDASAFLLQNGHLVARSDIVYFNNLVHKSESVRHMGDNTTGEGEGDDEQILIDLSRVPPEYDRIVIVVNIYQATQRHQHFGMIENAFIRVVDGKTNREILKYDLTENYSDCLAMVFGEVYRHGNEWKFNAVGQGTKDRSISELAKRYM